MRTTTESNPTEVHATFKLGIDAHVVTAVIPFFTPTASFPPKARGRRGFDYKLIVPHGENPWGGYLKGDALFQVAEDPAETRNRIADPELAGVASELRILLEEWWDGKG